MPTVSGPYRIKNNSNCNNGDGVVEYHTATGWAIPKAIKPFYQVLAWYDDTKPIKPVR